MKLPDSSYKTGVQSLGRENSRYAAGASIAKGEAMSKLLSIPAGVIKKAQAEYEAEENRQGRHKADMHLVGVDAKL